MGTALAVFFVLMAFIVFALSRYARQPKAVLLSPLGMFCMAWASSGAIYLFGDDFVREDTALALLGFYMAFVVPGIFLMLPLLRRLEIRRPDFSIESRVARRIARTLLAMQFLAAIAAVAYLMSAMSFANMSFFEVPNTTALRGVLAVQKYDVPVAFRLMSQLRYVNYFSSFVMLILLKEGHVGRGKVALSIILACLYPLCFMERSGLIRVMILTLIAYLYVTNISRAKVVRIGIVLSTLVAAAVIVVPIVRGQGDEGGANLYDYVAGAWSGFDNFVSGSGAGQVVILEDQDVYVTPGGYDISSSDSPSLINTMTEAYRICNALGWCDVKIGNFGEYVYAPIMTNIYTWARSFYQDFGPLGMIPAVAITSILFFFVYRRAISKPSVFSIYAVAYLVNVCIMSVLSDLFLLRDLIFPMIIMFVLSLCYGGRAFWFWHQPGEAVLAS